MDEESVEEALALFDIDISLEMTLAGGKVKLTGSANYHDDHKVNGVTADISFLGACSLNSLSPTSHNVQPEESDSSPLIQ